MQARLREVTSEGEECQVNQLLAQELLEIIFRPFMKEEDFQMNGMRAT
jgi:hypothetical protein